MRRFKRLTGEDKKNMAKHICDTYIRANSMQEINLDALARDKIIADLGNIHLSRSCSVVFIIALQRNAHPISSKRRSAKYICL